MAIRAVVGDHAPLGHVFYSLSLFPIAGQDHAKHVEHVVFTACTVYSPTQWTLDSKVMQTAR